MTSTRNRLSVLKPTVSLPALAIAACLVWGSAIPAASASETEPRGPVGGPLLGSIGVVAAEGSKALPKVNAKSFLVADLGSGEVLAAKNPHGRFRPASAIKVLTAVTLLPKLAPDSVYKATFADANVEGSRVGIVANGTYSAHNLFEGLFLTSGNDAASALAGAAGGLPQTVSQMNATAKRLGAFDTTAKNASGLDEPGQYSSAYDLAVIARAGMERADFRAYARTVKSTFPGKPGGGKASKPFEIYTQNKLVLNYPGAIGIKTGWTTQARGTFIGAATRSGRTLLVTVMNTGQGAWREAAALLDWGFANAALVKPVGTLNTSLPAVEKSTDKAELASTPKAEEGTDGFSWRSVAWPVLVLVGLVAMLRARVLVKRNLRARRRRNANLQLARRLYKAGITAPIPVDAQLPARGVHDVREDRVGRSA